jgi:pyruvate/2-oxoglutarate dehydrogenase complex dihydrolipoamide acyltransferase (E2) component
MSEVKIAPIVRQMAKADGVDLSEIKGSGKNGAITKADYERHTGKTIEAKPVREQRAPMNHLKDDVVEVGGMTFRKTRGDMDHSGRQKLGIPQKYLNKELEYRWVNDVGGRVERMRELGYETVDSKALSKDEEISVQRRVGTQEQGVPLNAVLMATPKKWKEDRHRKAEEIRTEKEVGMFRKPMDENGKPLGNEFYKKRGIDSGYRDS